MVLHCWETTASWQVVRWLEGEGGLGEGGGGEGGARGERTRLAQVPPEGSCPKGVPQQVVAIPSSI